MARRSWQGRSEGACLWHVTERERRHGRRNAAGPDVTARARTNPRGRPAPARGTRPRTPAGTSTARGARRPATATAHRTVSQVAVASVTCTQTMSEGSLSSYWTLPTSPWAASRTPRTVSGSSMRELASRWRCSSHTPITITPNTAAIVACWWTVQLSVRAPLKCRRWTTWPVNPPECGPAAVAAVPAKIVSAPSGASARTDHTPTPVAGDRTRSGLEGRAPGQRHGRDENHHRQREVAHHEAGREVLPDGEAAQDGLGEHAQRKERRQDRQISPIRTARERQHGRHHRDQAHDAGDRPVSELDQGVGAERRQRGSPAFRPVLAAQPGVGQPDRRAGQHDQGQRAERHVGDAAVLGGGDGEAVEHSTPNGIGHGHQRRSARRSASTIRSIELLEGERRPPAQPPARSARVADPRGWFAGALQAGVEADVVLGAQTNVGKRPFGELEHRVADPAGEDVVVRLVLLEHQPGPQHHVAGERPVADRRHVARALPPRPALA